MPNKSRTHYSTLNIIAGMGGYILNTILALVCRMVFTRTLNEDYLGVSGLFSNVITMLSLAELGIGSAIIYALYKPFATGDEDKVASLVKFYGKCYRIIGIVVAVVGIAVAPFLNLIITTPPNINENIYLLYFIFLFNTVFTYFFSYKASLITVSQRDYIITGVSYAITIVQNLMQMVWLFSTRDYIGYLVLQTIGNFAFCFIIVKIANKQYPYILNKEIKPLEKTEKKSLVRNVKALTIWKLSGLLVNSTDNLIITYFNGLATVGFASNYTILTATLNSLINQIFNSLTASVGNFNALESPKRKLELFYSINFANFWVFGWASVGIFVLSNDIVSLLFGEKYVLSLEIPLIMAINFYMVGMQNAVWTFKNTMGLFRPGRYLLLLTAALNLIFSIGLGTVWGLFGILLATAISRLFTNTWYDPYAVFKYGLEAKVSKYYFKYLYYLVVIIIIGSICYFSCLFISINPIVDIIIKFAICCILPNAIMIFVFRKTNEYAFFVEKAKQLIKMFFKRRNKKKT